MATKGQSLEKLVELLEKMDMEGAIIKTRDKIYDKVAKEDREVDVSIRFKTGSHDFLIVFECRDRGRKNGPDWIEQIAQKTKDIGANKVIAVSSSGFTRSAIEKAKHHNILLRTIDEISSERIFEWFKPKSLPIIHQNYTIKKIVFFGNVSDPEMNKKINVFIEKHREKINNTFPFILQEGMEKPKSPNESLRDVDTDLLFSGVPCDGPKVIKTVELYPENKSSGFELVIGEDHLKIDHMVLVAELSVTKTEHEIQTVKEYKTDNKTLAQIVQFEGIDFQHEQKNLELVLKPEGEGSRLSFRFKGPE
jgi:hypothetical protein